METALRGSDMKMSPARTSPYMANKSCWLQNYHMPSFHMAWMEIYITVWLHSSNRFRELIDAFHLLKH